MSSSELAPGPIYSFVPGDYGAKATAVAGQLSRTLSGEFGRSVLLADFETPARSVWDGEAPRRLDGRTWGAFVYAANGHDILDAREVHPRQLRQVLEYGRDHYSLVCADLSRAKEPHAIETLRLSDAVFLVGSADPDSLEMIRDKADWLRSIDMGDRCGLLLWRTRHGASAVEAEDFTGLPVCSMVAEGDQQLESLAAWLASHHERAAQSLAAAS